MDFVHNKKRAVLIESQAIGIGNSYHSKILNIAGVYV